MSGQTIIIKRRKAARSGGHHGGAWKVAYADFVTAMMAFFLLMWLLNATTEQQRKGIADYFDPSIPVSPVSGGGRDALMGDDVVAADAMASATPPETRRSAAEISEALAAAARRAGLPAAGGGVRVTETDEGTRIELLEGERRPLFATGSAAPSADLEALLAVVGAVVAESGAPVKITGHTDGHRFGSPGYTNWELSADRANTARRLLSSSGVDDGRITEVSGMANRAPLNGDAFSPDNRRIAITLLRSSAQRSGARGLR